MATRFYFRENGTAPITPSVDAGWESSASPFARKPMFTTTATDALGTVTGFTSTTGQDRCHRQLISEPMAAGITFNTGTTYKCYLQALESATNDNCAARLCVRILSQGGSAVRATPLALADYSTATEFNTALRNKAFANGDAGAGSYTTVLGDRLVVEIGHNDAAGASISASSRWGSQSTGVTDLGENETSTSTTERPWFETSANITFVNPTPLATTAAAQTSAIAVGVQVAGTLANSAPAQTDALAVGVRVTGTIASVAAAQTSAYEGEVQDTEITGTLASVAPAQTSAFAAGVVVSATVASSAPAQVSAIAAGVRVGVAAASTSAPQTSAVAVGVRVGVALASSQAAPVDALAVGVRVGAGVASAAPAQTSAIAVGVRVTGTLANSAPAQTSAYEGEVTDGQPITGTLASSAPAQTSAFTLSATEPEALTAIVRPRTTPLATLVQPLGDGVRAIVRPRTEPLAAYVVPA
jgi:hypothetical protein